MPRAEGGGASSASDILAGFYAEPFYPQEVAAMIDNSRRCLAFVPKRMRAA